MVEAATEAIEPVDSDEEGESLEAELAAAGVGAGSPVMVDGEDAHV